jgi:hypothetical protein
MKGIKTLIFSFFMMKRMVLLFMVSHDGYERMEFVL